jgi:hypothetical protein
VLCKTLSLTTTLRYSVSLRLLWPQAAQIPGLPLRAPRAHSCTRAHAWSQTRETGKQLSFLVQCKRIREMQAIHNSIYRSSCVCFDISACVFFHWYNRITNIYL